MEIFHNSRDLTYRDPFGAVPCGAVITLRCRAVDADACALRIHRDGEDAERIPMEPGDDGLFELAIRVPEAACLLWYDFEVTAGDNVVYYGNNSRSLGGIGECCTETPPAYQITVYKPDPVPEWFKNGVIYQIFPDRFARGKHWLACQQAAAERPRKGGPTRILQQEWTDKPFYPRRADGSISRWPFFGGTLEGIREKLPYLKKLGVTILYLNPIFKAASNHRYDTGDYMLIDEGLGTEADFRRLAKDAGKLGIRIMLDGVFSHTGADSRYFNRYGNYPGPGACGEGASPYDDWYTFKEGTDEYECWWGVKDLPNVKEETPSYLDFICRKNDSVVRHWLWAGASAWRLDVADELPDSFIEAVRTAMRETSPDSVLLGEVWEDASNKISYDVRRRYFSGDELQSVMNYPFREAAIDFMLGRVDAEELAERLESLRENYPPEQFYSTMNLIGSHDRCRILTLLGEAEKPETEEAAAAYQLSPEARALASSRLKALAALQFACPGVPSVYYGDEAGMEGFEDPYNRGTFPWGAEDKDIQSWFTRLGELRAQHPALRGGTAEPFAAGPELFGLRRSDGTETLTLFVNRSRENTWQIKLPCGMRDLLSGIDCGEEFQLPPLTAVLLK